MQSTFAKRQFESVVFCTLHTFTIFYAVIYSQSYKIYFFYFENWLNAGALLH